MSVVRQVARAVGDGVRAPGSAEEREAARRLVEWLQARGDAAELRVRRARPQVLAAMGIGAAVAALASLVSVAAPVAGVVGAAAGLLVTGLEAAGIVSPVRRLFPARETVDVLVPGGNLVVCAGLGPARRGIAFGPRGRGPTGRRRRIVAASAAAVVVAAAARALGAGGAWLGLAQLVPTLILLAAAGAALDAGLAGWASGSPAAAATAVGIYDELAGRPPAALAPGLLVHGAARPRLAAEFVLEVLPVEDGPVRWRATDARLAAAAERAQAALDLPADGPPLPPPPRGTIAFGGDQTRVIDLALAVADALDAAVRGGRERTMSRG